MKINEIYLGDCLEVMKQLEDNSISAIVTDPPYGLSFMGKHWDYDVPSIEIWQECLRVLKPGGYLLSFAGTRTQHRMAVRIEDAGFEIRDMIAWCFGQGLPKSLNIGKAVDKIQGNEKFKEQEIGFVKWLKSNLDCYWCSGLGVISDNEEGFGDPSSCLDCNGKGKHTIEDIDEWLGTKAQAFHFFAESDSNRQIPNAETYKILKNRLHLDNRYDDFVKKHSLLLEEIRELQGYEKSIKNWDKKYDKAILNKPKTELASEWEGWGTALKPSHEDITVARKPIETSTDKEYNLGICQKLFASIAKHNSMLNQPDLKGGQSIAQWIAEKNINTSEDLREAMVILQSYITANTNLNIVWSWLNILVENLIATNTSTISTKLNTTTELKILNSMEWENILANIIQAKGNKTNGLSADVYNAESLFNALKLKLNYILEHSADDNAIFLEKLEDLRPSLEPITVARKPLEKGLNVAENCLKWGVGGINIDGCRVEAKNGDRFGGGGLNSPVNGFMGNTENTYKKGTGFRDDSANGRFPANLIHDGSDEVVGLFPQSKSTGGRAGHTAAYSGGYKQEFYGDADPGYNDNGSAARFFYCAKSSRRERNMGCEELGGNKHCTVKPIALMEYLVKLVSREGAVVLDPFAGSGSTLIACKNLGRNFIGIEKEADYIEIAKARLSVHETQ